MRFLNFEKDKKMGLKTVEYYKGHKLAEDNTATKVDEVISVIKEDSDVKHTTDIKLSVDSNPSDILNRVKENIKKDKHRWTRVKIQFCVGDDIRKEFEINRELTFEIDQVVQSLRDFIYFVLGHDIA